MVLSDLQKANKLISSVLDNLTTQLSEVTEKVNLLEVELEENRTIIKQKDLEINYLNEQLSKHNSETRSPFPSTQEMIEGFSTKIIDSLRAHIDSSTQASIDKQSNTDPSYENKLSDLSQQLVQIVSSLSTLESKIDSQPSTAPTQIDEYEANYHDLKMVSTELATKIGSLEEIREENERKITDYENKMSILNEEIATLTQNNQMLQKEVMEQSESVFSEEKNLAFQEEIKKKETEFQEKLEEQTLREANHLEEINVLRAEVKILKEFKEKAISIDEPEQNLDSKQLQYQISKLENENQSFRKQIQTFDRIIDDIKKSEEEMDSETELTNEEITLIRSEKEGLIEKVTELQLSLDSLESKIKQKDIEVNKITEQLQEVEKLKKEYYDELHKVKSITDTKSNVNESLKAAEQTLREAEELLQTKNEENKELKEKIISLESQNQSLTEEQSDTRTLAVTIDNLQNQVNDLENSLKTTQTELEQKKIELEKVKTSSSRRRSSSRTMAEEPIRLESITNLSPEELREKLKTLLQNTIDLEADLDSAEDDIESLEDEIIKLKEKHESSHLELANKSSLLESRTTQLENLAKEFEEVRTKLETTSSPNEDDIVSRFKATIDDKDSMIRRLEEHQIQDQSTIAKLEATLEKISEENTQLKNMVDENQ